MPGIERSIPSGTAAPSMHAIDRAWPARTARRPAADTDVAGPGFQDSLISGNPRQNWAFYLFVVLIPLQNLYSQYVPNLGGGLNFLNVAFLLSLLLALHSGGRLVRGTGVNGWLYAYMAVGLFALLVGLGRVSGTETHLNNLKDQLIAMAFVLLAQLSATDWGTVRRLLLASLLPLPYMLMVLYDQHSAVSSWNYSHDLRIRGTFPELGANELAAFCVTAVLLFTAILLSVRLGWLWRLLLAIGIGSAATGVVLTYSRTAYIAVLLGFGVLLLLRRRRLRLLLPVLLAAALLPALLPPSAVQRFSSIEVEEGQRDESTDNRFVYWGVAWQQFSHHPLFGTGYHTFHHEEVNPYRTDTHNFFLRELVEKGLLGALVLFGLLYSVGRMLWRLYRRSPPGSWAYGFAIGMACAFVALLCGNLFGDRFTHYPMIAHFWLYVGLAIRMTALQQAGTQRTTLPRARPSLPERTAEHGH
jgi:putative inorganic carbon (hco3(-)) transporter